MSKLVVNEKLPIFRYDTPFKSDRDISDIVQSVKGKTAIIFLRYYGCTLCQFDIHEFSINYDKILQTDGQLLIVLQSDKASLAKQLTENDLPFDIVCDPKQTLYKKFEISPAKSKANLADFKTISKVMKAKKIGIKHGDYEGDELQLPATFIIDQDLTILYSHYGKSVSDVPTVIELIELLKK